MENASDVFSVETEIVTRCAEHEIFLSFVNDGDAVLFSDWLHEKGGKEFLKWREKKLKPSKKS